MSKTFAFAVAAAALVASSTAAEPAISETDAYALQTAEAACAARDFPALLAALSISHMTLMKYAAPEIAVRVGADSARVKREDNTYIPIATMDYYWVYAASVKAAEADPNAPIEPVKLDFNQSQSEVYRVDWQRVRYDGETEGGDDLGNIVETIGQPGYLLFRPTATCWELTDDIVGETTTGK